MRIRPFCLDSIPSYQAPLIGHAAAEKMTPARCEAVSTRIHDPLYHFNAIKQLSSCDTADRLASCLALAKLQAFRVLTSLQSALSLHYNRSSQQAAPEIEMPQT